MDDARWVQLHATDDTTALPVEIIEEFVALYTAETEADRRNLALADCLDYLARDDVYESYSRGGISVGKNRLVERAAQLRAQVGATVSTGTLSHAMYADAEGDYA